MTRLLAVAILLIHTSILSAQSLSVHWEELTAPDFVKAIQKSEGTCLLPIGIMEKHGPHLPLGNDLINVRDTSLRAAQQEYAVVFPEYFAGQIFEARHQPGTVAYSAHLQLELLQETTDEMGRNGCKKIVIVNGHGGNEYLLPYFAQSQLQSPHDYIVYVFSRLSHEDAPGRPALKFHGVDWHAGEAETSRTMAARPDLVHLDRANQESGADQARQKLPDSLYTGIWWYARFPNHYSGDGSVATKELGEFDAKTLIADLVAAIKAVKADSSGLKLQKQFYEEATHPLDTKQ
ncbi:MAG TPA: creatininase family protein [Terriglobales bacterium]|nr:creatininase family protein [Terriglobales bacterium]